jgi:ABC-type bacteriocin/lantibiotic exporter with double-glycine peptidase domain
MSLRRKRYDYVPGLTSTDCGPAALSMVARFYKKYVTLPFVRNLLDTNAQGTSLRSMEAAAHSLGFNASAGKAKTDRIADFPLPAILHYDDSPAGHYVVLYEIRNGVVTLGDPSSGICHLPLNAVLDRWSGFVLLLHPADDFVADGEGLSLAPAVLVLVRRYGKPISLCVIFGAAALALGYSTALLLRVVVDRVLPHRDFRALSIFAFGCLLAWFIRYTLNLVRAKLVRQIGEHVETELGTVFLQDTIGQPLRDIERGTAGDLYVRLNDSSKVRNAMTANLLSTGLDVCCSLVALGMLAFIDGHLLWIVLAYLIAMTGFAISQSAGIIRADRTLRHASGEFAVIFIEVFANIRAIKVNAAENHALKLISAAYGRLLTSMTSRERASDHFVNVGSLISGLAAILFICSITVAALKGHASTGELVFSYTLVALFFASADRLALSSTVLYEGVAGLRRLKEQESSTYSQKKAMTSGHSVASVDSFVELSNVSFFYKQDVLVLTKCSMQVKRGEIVAIVGSSGSGKSTLASIIAGILPVTAGSLTYQGQIISPSTPTLRKDIGIVFQDGLLMRGTIRDNIDMGFGADNAAIHEAACICGIGDFIQSQPKGYNSMVASLGTSLSSGQRQRICLARAILRDPTLLILDEATSSLDLDTEAQVMSRLLARRSGLTTLIISHRPSVVALADRVVYMKEGQIVGRIDSVADCSISAIKLGQCQMAGVRCDGV